MDSKLNNITIDQINETAKKAGQINESGLVEQVSNNAKKKKSSSKSHGKNAKAQQYFAAMEAEITKLKNKAVNNAKFAVHSEGLTITETVNIQGKVFSHSKDIGLKDIDKLSFIIEPIIAITKQVLNNQDIDRHQELKYVDPVTGRTTKRTVIDPDGKPRVLPNHVDKLTTVFQALMDHEETRNAILLIADSAAKHMEDLKKGYKVPLDLPEPEHLTVQDSNQDLVNQLDTGEEEEGKSDQLPKRSDGHAR